MSYLLGGTHFAVIFVAAAAAITVADMGKRCEILFGIPAGLRVFHPAAIQYHQMNGFEIVLEVVDNFNCK